MSITTVFPDFLFESLSFEYRIAYLFPSTINSKYCITDLIERIVPAWFHIRTWVRARVQRVADLGFFLCVGAFCWIGRRKAAEYDQRSCFRSGASESSP